MAESQNIQIPIALFRDITLFFDLLSLSGISIPKIYKFEYLHEELNKKQNKINLRTAYTRMARAKDDEQRIAAKKDYVTIKQKGKRMQADNHNNRDW